MAVDAPAEIERAEETGEVRATLVEHLDELRTRVLRSVFVIGIGWIAGYLVEPYVYRALAAPLRVAAMTNPGGLEIVFRSFAAPFFLRFSLGLVISLILTAPFLVLQLWGFVKPGLRPNERKAMQIVGPVSVVLFFGGVALAWFILPAGFKWFLSFLSDFSDAKLFQDPKDYVSFVLKMFLAFGVGFQLPIILVTLAKLRIISDDMLWKYWRQALVVMAVAAMVLTPSGDAFSMLMLFFPLVFLYFGTVAVLRMIRRADRKRASAD